MDWNIIQNNFTAGILSPRFVGQVNNDLVRAGLQTADNAFIFPQGPCAKRPGTHLLHTLFSPLNSILANVRVWRFIGPENNDLIAVFYDGIVAVYDAIEGQLGGDTAPFSQLLPNTVFPPVDELTYWVGENYNWNPNYHITTYWALYLGSGSARMRSQTDTAFFISAVPTDFLPAQNLSSTIAVNPGLDEWRLKARVILDETMKSQLADPRALYFEVELTLLSGVTELDTQVFSIEPATEEIFQLEYTNPGTLPESEITVRVRLHPLIDPLYQTGQTVKQGTYFELIVREVTLESRFTPGPPSPIQFITTYTNEEIGELHFVQSPYNNRELIVLHPNHPPMALYYNAGPWAWLAYPFTSSPPEWAANNYPGIGTAFQGRLVLSGVPSFPEKIWASASGNWPDMYDATPSGKGDALELVAQERDVNTWLAGLKGLLYGDRRAERLIRADSTLVAFDDIVIVNQSGYGSLRMPQKIIFGKNIVLATGGKADLRLVRYSDENGGFIAPNILAKAEQLGRPGFRSHFYSRKPHMILWSVMLDGSVLLCHFDDEMEMAAWTKIPSPANGRYVDGCVTIDEDGNDIVTLISVRQINTNVRIFFEVIQNLNDLETWSYVDILQTYQGPFTLGPMLGFDEYINQTVAVFYNGEFAEYQQVNVLGELNITDDTATTLTVGLPYNFKVTTFPQGSIAIQSGLVAKKRYSQLGVRGVFSSPPVINGQRPPDRDPNNLMNVSINPVAVLDTKIVDMNFSETAEITIEEDQPVGLMVAAIFGKITSNQL